MRGAIMRFMSVMRLKNASHEEMRKGLETFLRVGGGSGLQSLLWSTDAKTVFIQWEGDDPAEMQKFNALYAPYFESGGEIHVVIDVAEAASNYQAGLDMAP
jgi:hypothetical protein